MFDFFSLNRVLGAVLLKSSCYPHLDIQKGILLANRIHIERERVRTDTNFLTFFGRLPIPSLELKSELISHACNCAVNLMAMGDLHFTGRLLAEIPKHRLSPHEVSKQRDLLNPGYKGLF